MKQLKHRTIFVLIFALLLALGTVLFCVLYVARGRAWASSPVNQAAYSQGQLADGTILDRNGTLLFDCAGQSYGDGALLRRSTLHLVGDLQGNIATGARRLFSRQLVSYNPITGLNSTGNDLYLSIDAGLNETAYQALNGRAGTVAVYNYKTGEVLCLTSSPSYDPIDADEVAAVAAGDSAYTGAYMNRFLSSTYTPGSIFKVVTAAAALERLDTDSFHYTCTGSLEIAGGEVTCPSVHGELDFASALAHSCNGAFATLALELGGETLEQYVRQAGLLDSVEVSGYPSASGSFDVAGDGTLELGWSGVGQYNDLVNPCAMMVWMGAIANQGKTAVPYLISKTEGDLPLPSLPHFTKHTGQLINADTAQVVGDMMANNVRETYGSSRFPNMDICAKSGTAEVGGGKQPNAWFAGFLRNSDAPYAFVVVLEEGGSGANAAGNVAAQVLDALVNGY